MLASNQVTAGQTYNFAYTYNLAGALTSETLPSGRVVTDTYDGANRPLTVAGTLGTAGKTYVTGVNYAPHGGYTSFQLGNQLFPNFSYNKRLQVGSWHTLLYNDPAEDFINGILNWGAAPNNNGSLRGVTETNDGPSYPAHVVFNQLFTYDKANRLATASDDGGWSRTFGYDQFGNMWVPSYTGIPPRGGTVSNVNNYDPATNRINAGAYDLAGNLTGLTGMSLAYDAQNGQKSATQAGIGTVTYLYDGNGQRVEKLFTSGGNTVYVYDANGQLAAEYDTGSVPTPPCTTCYLSWDHLGSTRLVTDQSGNLVTRHDYLPFGEEIAGGSAGRNTEFEKSSFVRQKFTGQERDTETGLDFFNARYLSAGLGRFSSPDEPLVDQFENNPQSWNLYSYVRNNPLRNVDPTGNACVYGGSGDLNDSGNYSDDNSGGQSCSEAFSPQQNSQPSATVYGQGGNQLEAFGLNLGFALSNIANSYFSFIAPTSQLLSQTPTNREFTGQLATGVAIAGTALIGPGGEEAAVAKEIKVSWGRLVHVLGLHTGGVANKSFFGDAAEVVSLIKAAESATPIPSIGGKFVRIVDAGRTVGTDISTGQPTSIYTVVTDSSGGLVSAFPGGPRR